MLTPSTPELLHFVGYLTGATLYAMLLVMAARTRGRRDRLTVATAMLGLAWNVGELSAHALAGLDLERAADWMAAASYGALGFLAAVAVHSAGAARSAGTPSPARPWTGVVLATMYGCAAAAALMQTAAAATAQALPSRPALVLLTAGVGLVAVPLIVITRGQTQSRRALWMIALALFAVSALHLSRFHGAAESWPMELVGHHASIPLAFAILYQDYRFALADLFLKRDLTLLVLVAVVFAAWSLIASTFVSGGMLPPEGVAALLAAWMATALLFPWLHRAVGSFVDRAILLRTGYATVIDDMAASVQRATAPDALLSETCAALVRALGAAEVRWEPAPDPAAAAPDQVVVPTAEAPHYVLTIGPLAGGRRVPADGGIGLANIERRLRCCYGDTASLELFADDRGTVAELRLPAENVDHEPQRVRVEARHV